MTQSGTEKLPNYTGMQVGGCVASAVGSIGLSILLTVGIATRVFLPTGFASLTMGAGVTGVLLLVGRIVLRQANERHMDVIQSTTAIFDEMRITRDEMAADRADRARLLNAVEKLLSQESGTSQRATGGGSDGRPVSRKAPRQRKRRSESTDAGGSNVVPMRSRRAADALRRLTEQITDEPNA